MRKQQNIMLGILLGLFAAIMIAPTALMQIPAAKAQDNSNSTITNATGDNCTCPEPAPEKNLLLTLSINKPVIKRGGTQTITGTLLQSKSSQPANGSVSYDVSYPSGFAKGKEITDEKGITKFEWKIGPNTIPGLAVVKATGHGINGNGSSNTVKQMFNITSAK